jgi:hypothetical protein
VVISADRPVLHALLKPLQTSFDCNLFCGYSRAKARHLIYSGGDHSLQTSFGSDLDPSRCHAGFLWGLGRRQF